jgi:hypothetical protein
MKETRADTIRKDERIKNSMQHQQQNEITAATLN